MSTQSGHERPVDANPNPLGTCFCGVLREDCPGGAGFVSPNEIEGVPGNYANFISLECVKRLAGDDREKQHVSQEPAEDAKLLPGGIHTTIPDPAHSPVGPERHVNPSAETLEEATRLLEARDELARLEDDGGPVI